jgi:hypothetical protein
MALSRTVLPSSSSNRCLNSCVTRNSRGPRPPEVFCDTEQEYATRLTLASMATNVDPVTTERVVISRHEKAEQLSDRSDSLAAKGQGASGDTHCPNGHHVNHAFHYLQPSTTIACTASPPAFISGDASQSNKQLQRGRRRVSKSLSRKAPR